MKKSAGKCTRGGEVAIRLVRVSQIEPGARVVVVHGDDAQVHARGGGGAAGLRSRVKS